MTLNSDRDIANSPSAAARSTPDQVVLSRRRFLQSAGTLASGPLLGLAQAQESVTSAPVTAKARPAALQPRTEPVSVALKINEERHELVIEPNVTLLSALRDYLGLMGTKKGCDRGQCGACTVLVNGRRINSCLTLAVMHEGDRIVTVEGLGRPERMHPVQAAFVKYDAFQCGYCTPGQVCSAVALLDELKKQDASAVTPDVRTKAVRVNDEEIRERMSGNLCRCGAYPNIVSAVRSLTAGRERKDASL